MYIVIACSVVAFLLTLLESMGTLKKGMFWGFAIVTVLAMIHYDYGNDYPGYYLEYQRITAYDNTFAEIFDEDMFRDPGWAVLNYLFKPFGDYGFFVLVALISLFQNIAAYKIIRHYLPHRQWAFGTFAYLFNSSFYLLNFSMLRQGLVVLVFLALWPLIEKRKVIVPLIVLLLCTTIHGSAKILLPFVFFGFIPMGKNAGVAFSVIYVLLFVFLFVSPELLNDLLTMVIGMSESFADYSDTYAGADAVAKYAPTFRVGFAVSCIPIVCSLIFIGKQEEDASTKQYVALFTLGTIITIFSSVIPLLGRVAYYFVVYSIIAVPMVYGKIKNPGVRLVVVFLFCFMTLYGYFSFFNSPIWRRAYSEFHTIFSVM